MKPQPTPTPKSKLQHWISASAVSLLSLAPGVLAQYAPPPPPAPFAGFINEALRKDSPDMSAWDIGGLARIRYEIKDGAGSPGVPGSIDFRAENSDNHNTLFLERIQLRAAYNASWWGIHVEGRSSLAQGDERFAYASNPVHKGKGPEHDPIDLHQAFLTVGNTKEFPLTLKLGRQEFAYADERLVGAIFWNNVGRAFDAAKLRWHHDLFWVDAFIGRPVIPVDDAFNTSNDYETLGGVWANSTKLLDHHSLDFFFLSRDASGDAVTAVSQPEVPLPSARDIYTVGARLKSKPGDFGGWDYAVDAYGQFGNFRDLRAGAPTHRLDHLAYAFIANFGYTFTNCPGKPRLALEYAHASGDSDPTDGDHGTFDNLYPTNHKFYGYADFVSLQNIHDLHPILTVRPTARLSVALEGHLFWLADTDDSYYTVGGAPRGGVGPTPGTGFGINPSYDSFLGGEIDLVAGYALTRYAQLEAGFCRFFTGPYIESSLADPAFGSRDAMFSYVQFMVRF